MDIRAGICGDFDCIAVLQAHGRCDGVHVFQKLRYNDPAEAQLAFPPVGVFHQPCHHICQPLCLLLDRFQIAGRLVADMVGGKLHPGQLGIAGDHRQRRFQLMGDLMQEIHIEAVHAFQHLAPTAAFDQRRFPFLNLQIDSRGIEEDKAQHPIGCCSIAGNFGTVSCQDRFVQQARQQDEKAGEHQNIHCI